MDRAVKPHLTFRNTRWPWTRTLALCQDKLQRRMLAQFLHVERIPNETSEVWNRSRMRAISQQASVLGTWGKDHARRVLA